MVTLHHRQKVFMVGEKSCFRARDHLLGDLWSKSQTERGGGELCAKKARV